MPTGLPGSWQPIPAIQDRNILAGTFYSINRKKYVSSVCSKDMKKIPTPSTNDSIQESNCLKNVGFVAVFLCWSFCGIFM